MTYQEKLALYLGYKGHNKTLAQKLSRGPGNYNTPKLDSQLLKLGLLEPNTTDTAELAKAKAAVLAEMKSAIDAKEEAKAKAKEEAKAKKESEADNNEDEHDAVDADNNVEELAVTEEVSAPETEPVVEKAVPVKPVDDSKKKKKA